ncbi:hypothetical protein CERSUDRAFT_101255 [Gelatoporia subvermispora B]|uniref:Uncharacterized protein n=1 Tax=Ceriporiopsis subvermispora (strain B) TaxID=914234 RepID=M2P5N6_CERS8|nr:hypothetical protein CERSUDRAFT_101255 [Gelatoporia subvermispora B]
MTLVGPSTATLRTIQDNLSQMHDGRQGGSHAHPSSQPDPPLPLTLPTLMHQPSTANIPPSASPDSIVSSVTLSASPSPGPAAPSATRESPSVPPQAYVRRAAYPLLAAAMQTASVFSLPVELLSRIFQLGVLDAPAPDQAPPGPTFEVLASHVCAHWRAVAVHTSCLWTTIHFSAVPHLERARAYLARSTKQPIDIFVDSCAEADHLAGTTLFRDEFDRAFELVLPQIARWRSLTLKVRDLGCKARARKWLSSCGPAPRLTRLQLWHIEDWGSPEGLFTAIGPPPVVVFDGTLPALEDVSLIGVNLPWARSPFLSGLRSLELGVHSDDVRIPFDLWRAMLVASPALERLKLYEEDFAPLVAQGRKGSAGWVLTFLLCDWLKS